MKNEVSRVEFLLKNNIPVLIYNGQDDLIVQTAGTMKWVEKINFSGSFKFTEKQFTPWKIGNSVVGSTKSEGPLTLNIVNNAGHMVPMDNPIAALNMISTFVDRYK